MIVTWGLTPEEGVTGSRHSVDDTRVGVEEAIVSLTKKIPLSLWNCHDLSGHRRLLTQDTKEIKCPGLNLMDGLQNLYPEPQREGVKLLDQESKPPPLRTGVGAEGRLKKVLWLQ